jgi:hypothetical protein
MSRSRPMYKIELLKAWDVAIGKGQVTGSDWSDFVDDWEENKGSPYATYTQKARKKIADEGYESPEGELVFDVQEGRN